MFWFILSVEVVILLVFVVLFGVNSMLVFWKVLMVFGM